MAERKVAFVLLALSTSALAASNAGPLVLKSQGSFFVGGESKSVQIPATSFAPAQSGEVVVDQMYVQYQVPVKSDLHTPIVLIHGCCLSGKTWETTPDGRMGWSEYFVRHDRSVYLTDQVSRARSGFDPTIFYEISSGRKPVSQMPTIVTFTKQVAWIGFRFGPEYGKPFPDQQFPMNAIDEFYKQMIPDLNALLPQSRNPTWRNLADLAVKLKGAVAIGHSESGFFPQRAALIDADGIKGIVTIETECDTELTPAQVGVLAKIPALIIFGDHLADAVVTLETGRWTWANALETCKNFAEKIKIGGGDVELVHLPDLGIKGNSHMLMQDKNSDQLAQMILDWIEAHVESKSRH